MLGHDLTLRARASLDFLIRSAPIYVPPAFAIDDQEATAILSRIGFGALVTQDQGGLVASHLPFLLEQEPLRILGHLARANLQPQGAVSEAMLIVQGPQAYISPGFYPSKAEHGRVVPTWNYEAVHVYGTVHRFDDPDALLRLVTRLTEKFEQNRPQPWAVADAPSAYVSQMLSAIVGLELRVTRIEGVRKLSQNRNEKDRSGVIAGLSASRDALDQAVAESMRR